MSTKYRKYFACTLFFACTHYFLRVCIIFCVCNIFCVCALFAIKISVSTQLNIYLIFTNPDVTTDYFVWTKAALLKWTSVFFVHRLHHDIKVVHSFEFINPAVPFFLKTDKHHNKFKKLPQSLVSVWLMAPLL